MEESRDSKQNVITSAYAM